MYICICNGVTDREILSAVARGASTLDCLRDQLGVASCCGTCACAAEELLTAGGGRVDQAVSAAPAARPGGAASRPPAASPAGEQAAT